MKVSFHCPACCRNAFGITRPRWCVVVIGFVALTLHEMKGAVCRGNAPDGEAARDVHDTRLRYGKSVAAVGAEASDAKVALAH